ncbi:hypothetical protein M885DRAFT_504470 [Pelagophyceae sp. CCMP2097]|nr:hypothetical protein M885DRAFT_504470 [Pelagophyceae sp. CCMP2097]
MSGRTASSCDADAARLERELVGDPDNARLLFDAAEALNAAMRIKTQSNTITIDGTINTPERRRIWATDGPRAYALASRAMALTPKANGHDVAIYADAFMFSRSHESLVKQAFTGVGSKYKALAERLQRDFPEEDGDIGSAILACFNHVAPWPVGSLKAALVHAQRAVSVGGPTLRNLYYVGVILYSQGNFAGAAEHFQRALDADAGSPTEADFGDFLREQSQSALERARAKGVKSSLVRRMSSNLGLGK